MSDDDDKKNFGYSDSFGIFENPVYQTGTVDTRYIPYNPSNQISDEGSIDFYVSRLMLYQTKKKVYDMLKLKSFSIYHCHLIFVWFVYLFIYLFI